MSRERAASLAIKINGFENKGMKEDDIKTKAISPLFPNSDFLQNRKNSTISNQSEKKNNIVPVLEMKSTNKTTYNDLQPKDHRVNGTDAFKGKVNETYKENASDIQTLSVNSPTNNENKINNFTYEQRVDD